MKRANRVLSRVPHPFIARAIKYFIKQTTITLDVNPSRSTGHCVFNVGRKFESHSDQYSKLTKSTKVDLCLPSGLRLQHVRAKHRMNELRPGRLN